MSGKRSSTKGKNFERWVANKFRELGIEAKRNLDDVYGDQGVDVIADQYVIQCKARKNYCPVNTIEEIKLAGTPIVVTKGDRMTPMAVLKFDDLLQLIKSFQGENNENRLK